MGQEIYEVVWFNDYDGVEKKMQFNSAYDMVKKYRELKQEIKYGYCKVALLNQVGNYYTVVDPNLFGFDSAK